MSPLGLIFLLALIPGQNTAQNSRQSDAQRATIARLQEMIRKNPQAFHNLGVCFAIRSYNFEREDGQAPRLVSTTTCTPGNRLMMKNATEAPKPRLVPASSD